MTLETIFEFVEIIGTAILLIWAKAMLLRHCWKLWVAEDKAGPRIPAHRELHLTEVPDSSGPAGAGGQGVVSSAGKSDGFRWLVEQATLFKGKWVALDGCRLVALADDPHSVRAAARAAGVDRPLVVQLAPGDELPLDVDSGSEWSFKHWTSD